MPVSVTDWLAYAAVMLLPGAVAAYLCGCFNGAVIVSKYILKDDVRGHGSGNAGLTNFHRAFGGKLTAVVLLLDIVKMVAAVALVAWWLGGTDFSRYWAGLWCLLGHMFPCMFGFKGGKGVLSGATLLFCLDWRMGLMALALFAALVALTRYVSLGSCAAALCFPLGTVLFVSRAPLIIALSLAMAALVIFMHRGNLQRLIRGEERKFSLHRK